MRAMGKYVWITQDVLEKIDERSMHGDSVNNALKRVFGLEAKSNEEKPDKPKTSRHRSYDVSGLAVGETKQFPLSADGYALRRSWSKYARDTGKEFEQSGSPYGCRVRRIK